MKEFKLIASLVEDLYATKGKDDDVKRAFRDQLPKIEAFVSEHEGKWLFGTNEPTMLDVYAAPTLEKIVDLSYGSSKNVAFELRINSYKSLAFYVACFRGHPAFSQIHMSKVAHDKQWSRNL